MENICIDHMANQEHFLRIDARLGEHVVSNLGR